MTTLTQMYLKDSERTEKKFPEGMILTPHQAELLHATLGVASEAGELTDGLKKHLIYGASLDDTNIKEEAGDILWYLAIICRRFNINFEQLMEQNIAKLEARFPEKFSSDNALNRDLERERQVLERHD